MEIEIFLFNMKNFLLGLTLFFLVVTVLYGVIGLQPLQPKLQVLIPLVVFSGFFIFLVAAMLVALTIFEYLKERKQEKK